MQHLHRIFLIESNVRRKLIYSYLVARKLEITLLNQNQIHSRNHYTENEFIKIMDVLIDAIFVVFGEMMLQQTIYNRNYIWNKQTMNHTCCL